MQVAQFTLNEPDDDGDMSAEFSLQVFNSSQVDIRLVKSTILFANQEGLVFASNEDESEVRIEPDSDETLGISLSWIKSIYCAGATDGVSAKVAATLYSREWLKLGSSPVPKNETDLVALKPKFKSNHISPALKVLVSRTKPDDDGDINLEFRCAVTNASDQPLGKVMLKAELIDEDDSILNTSTGDTDLAPRQAKLIECSMWNLKRSVLKGAQLKFSMAVFVPVLQEECEATSASA